MPFNMICMAGWSERLDVHSDAFGELPWSGAHTVNVVQRDLGVQILCSLKIGTRVGRHITCWPSSTMTLRIE